MKINKVNNIPVKRIDNILNTLLTQIETDLNENGKVSISNIEAFRLFAKYKSYLNEDTKD